MDSETSQQRTLQLLKCVLVSNSVYIHMLDLKIDESQGQREGLVNNFVVESSTYWFKNFQGFDAVSTQRLDDHVLVVARRNQYAARKALESTDFRFYGNELVLFVYKKTGRSYSREPWVTIPLEDIAGSWKYEFVEDKYFAAKLASQQSDGTSNYYLISRESPT